MNLVKVNSETSKIEIEFEYDTTLLGLVRGLPERTWDKTKKIWRLPLSPFHAKCVVDALENKGFQIDPRLHSLSDYNLKGSFLVKRDGLYDFQSEAIDFLNGCTPKGRALIADEQGLGKTIEALYWISQMPDIHKILVVCPASVLFKWKAEIEKWDESKSSYILEHGSDPIPDVNYLIMSYSIMTRKVTELIEMPWDCIIYDECHKLKSSSSQRSRAAKNLNSKYVLALSGTPVLNRPIEFFNVLNLINPGYFGSWWSYVHRYCAAKETYWGLDTKGASNLDELAVRLSPHMIRRLKRDVLKELPDLVRTKIPVIVNGMEINTAYRNLYVYLKEHGHTGEGAGDALVKLNVLRQAIGRAKIPLVVQLAQDLLDEDADKKIVIYAVHKATVTSIENSLKQYGVTTITGDVPTIERQNRQMAFQNRHLPRVMIISSAGGEGIDLYRADTIIFAEREWGPAPEEQAEARCHRIGQKASVEAMYLVAKSTVDEDIDTLIESKRAILGQLLVQSDIKLSIIDNLFENIMRRKRG